MRSCLLIFCFLSVIANGQTYLQYDTMQDAKKANQLLLQLVNQQNQNPELFYSIALKKRALSELDSVIFYCNKAMELLYKNSNKQLLVKCLHVKGTAQYLMDDRLKARESWGQGLHLALAENNLYEAYSLASNMGASYLDNAPENANLKIKYKISDSFFKLAMTGLIKADSLHTNQGLLTLRLIGTSFQYQKKYDSANYYYNKIIQFTKFKDRGVHIGALSTYAQSLSEMGNHTKAIAIMKEALALQKSNASDSKETVAVLKMYAQILFNAQQYNLAYIINDSSYHLLAADYQKVNAKAFAESESKFKNEILQYQISLEKEKRNRLYYLFAGLGLLGLLTLLFLQNRNNKIIAEEKAKQKQISIDAFIEGEEKEKARIGRELHDGIAQEIVAVKLALVQNNAPQQMVDELTRISLDIRNISHELMPQTLKEYGLKLAIEDICQKILTPTGILYELHSNFSAERLPNKIEITLYRIFQELAHNIIKHSKATEVLVQLRKMNNHILLVVEDNGKGFIHNQSDGIGIGNLKSRVQLLDGNLQYESSETEGTTAIVRVPL